MKRKFLTAALTLVFLAGLILPASAEEFQDTAPAMETIRIETVEDLMIFADNCALDSWSRNKQVLLLADLSLEGVDFEPIPTFGGSFDGGGHCIEGLTVHQSVTPAGLFGCLQFTSVIANLTVRGSVTPSGDGMAAGGIVGENYGTVVSCAFHGEVEGQANTGGIAGINYGILRKCTAEGSATGSNRTGGIAGYNDGLIEDCQSAMAVNTESVDPAIDPTDINLDFNLDFSRRSDLNVSDAASDTGGIAGYSSGAVRNCVNTGDVGYPHIGYNLGGIAGRSCGLVENCRNEGRVTGRKDIGGVVGQVEPHIETVLSPDYLETLSKQFENLGGLVSRAGSDGASMGGDVQSCIKSISGYQSSARSALESLAAGAGSGEVDEDALAALGSAVQGMANASGRLRSVIGEGVDTVSDDISAITGQISAISRTFALAAEDAKQDTVTDISDVDLDSITEGRVAACVNRASVEGDLNVGGITGIMGLESTSDPEDDTPNGNLFQRRRYEMKDIVDNCENSAAVIGKRSYVGGICGRMELGLIMDSRGYGSAVSENGDYVGGIAGMTGGTIRDCFAKCALSGGSYIGGIVGSGIDEDYSGDSSMVTGCYSMVEILESEQYVGAISGVNTGVFTDNYFVSDTLEGMNRVSYSALAEPISYDALRRIERLPSALRRFTLTFVVDGEILKTIPFDYGDSFDASVFPEIPQKEGYYAQWSVGDLTDLRFDTVVEATYYPHITALNSPNMRPDGRALLFVQGQFKDGDSISVTTGAADFSGDENLLPSEQWHISIPADGLESHTIRFLPAQENTEVFLLKNGGWSSVPTEKMGSYLAFEAAGAEVEIAVVSAPSYGLRWMIPAAGLLLAVMLLIIWRKNSRYWKKKAVHARTDPSGKKKRRLLLLVLPLVCGAGVVLCLRFPRTKEVQVIQAYDILKSYLEQPEQKLSLTVKARIEDKDTNFTAEISRGAVGDIPVSSVSENGRELYYSGGVVFLENGDAFRLNSAAPDYSELLKLVTEIYELAEVDAEGGVYTITAEDARATAILKLLMPSAEALLPEANRLTVDLITEDGMLSQLRFTGAGNLTDSVKTPFSLSAEVGVLPVSEEISIPKAVSEVIASGDYQAREIYSDDLVQLMEAWSQIRTRNPIAAEVTLETFCGPLAVSDDFRYYQWKWEGTTISGIEKDGETIYFTDGAICDADGKTIPTASAEDLAVTKILEIVYQNFSKAEYQCCQENGASVYSVTLSRKGMEQITDAVFSRNKETEAFYEKGSLRLVIRDGYIESVSVTCGGTGKILDAAVDASLNAEIRFQNSASGPALPKTVRDALVE